VTGLVRQQSVFSHLPTDPDDMTVIVMESPLPEIPAIVPVKSLLQSGQKKKKKKPVRKRKKEKEN
jgi:hypothetical protein